MWNLQNVGHYKTLYWEFTRFSKILEYCYMIYGNKVYLPLVHRVYVCCVYFGRNLRWQTRKFILERLLFVISSLILLFCIEFVRGRKIMTNWLGLKRLKLLLPSVWGYPSSQFLTTEGIPLFTAHSKVYHMIPMGTAVVWFPWAVESHV